MVKKEYVRSFYSGMLVTCYEYNGIKYVANQHGDWDVYENEYARGECTRVVPKESKEIKEIITKYSKHNK